MDFPAGRRGVIRIGAARGLLHNRAAWQAASERCLSYMAREYGEDKILSAYLDAFEGNSGLSEGTAMMVADDARAA